MSTSQPSPIETAISRAGGATALGRQFKKPISGKAVMKWVRDRVPAERVLRIEAVTGVSRHDLRPDIYPRVQCSCADCAGRSTAAAAAQDAA